MRENSSNHTKMIDRNWATKRKRKRLPCGPDVYNGKEGTSVSLESPSNEPLAKHRRSSDGILSRSSRKKKGNDGYYYECVVCDLGGNLLCCDSCPRTYHLECLNPPLKRTPPGKWQCPTCCEQDACLKSIRNAESTSKQTRTKIIIKSYKPESKTSNSNKASGTVESCVPGNDGSSCREKPPSLKVVLFKKKPDSSQADISLGTKSSNVSRELFKGASPENVGIEEKPNLNPVGTSGSTKSVCDIKESHSPGTFSEVQLEGGPSKRVLDLACSDKHLVEKFSSPVGCTNQKSKKRKQNKGKDLGKKKRKHDKKKSSVNNSHKHSKPISSSPGNSKTSQKGNAIHRQVSISPSKEDPGEKSPGSQKKDPKSLEETPHSSNESDELQVALEGRRVCEENALVEFQQVDRILGCRSQSSGNSSSLNPVECSTSPLDAAPKNSSAINSSDVPSSVNSDCSKTLEDNSLSGNKAVDTEDAKSMQKSVIENNSRETVKSTSKADTLHVYRRSVVKKCTTQGDSQGSTDKSVQDKGLSNVHAAVPDESADSNCDIRRNIDNIVLPENSAAQHDLGVLGDCREVGTSEAPVSCDKLTKEAVASNRIPDSNRDAKGEAVLEDLMPLDVGVIQYEFLVKWVGRSHIHNSWVSEAQLKVLAKRKLDNYKAKYGTTVLNIFREEWSQPQRVISLRVSLEGSSEAFIKWTGLPYDECTWESLDEPAISKYPNLIEDFKKFEQQTLDNDASKMDSMKRLSLPSDIHPLTEQPKELTGGLLFPHQLEALNWLRKCRHKSKNVILADEMGLGKTVSACAFLSSLYFEFKATLPCLVLVPLSTMPNWLSEFALWAPHLNVVEYHGSARARSMIRLYEWHATYPDCLNKRTKSYRFNVLLTTYEMVLADSSYLRAVPWEVLIVDEGHRLKNSESKLFSQLNSFSFQQRILLTGTPLQNNIGEMYNLLNFLQPSSFPSLSSFEEKFNDLTTAEKVDELKKLVAPHMLRRLKKDVMQNIPPKTERMVPVELSTIQAEYYRAMLTKNYQVLRNIGKGVAQQSMLNIVMQLRKVCNHPYLIPGTEPESGSLDFLHEMRINASAKLTLLHSMLRLLHKEGHRVLIFSQMTKLLDILEDYLNIEYGPKTFERVDGSVTVAERQAAIARFNHDKSRFVFLLSTRSCGLGINLASADTVIIYDSDFNPHADIQAMNRAHRIGQSSRLLVYRLVVRASVEERILQLAKKKLMLDQLFVNKSGSQKEVEDILRWGTEELFSDSSTVLGKDKTEESPAKDESSTIEPKQRRRVGGLGDVYEDKCTDGNTKILWDESAILKLLDRSILQSSPSEGAEGDLENDMLGSVKSLEWNDDPVEEPEKSEIPSPVAEDADAQSSEKKEDHAPGGNQGNEWDRLLRVRWEKYQSEEEAALGRGKRLRKAISYSETYAPHPSETPPENGNEEEVVPEREYTPAGRALKAKYSKLRARQKERIAQKSVAGGSGAVDGQSEIEPQPNEAKENETEVDLVREHASKVNDSKTNHPVDISRDKSESVLALSVGLKHSRKNKLSSNLDITVRPPDSSPSDICIQNHLSQSSTYACSVAANNLLPVLGLCAPNAIQLESVNKKKHESDNPAAPNYSQSRKSKKLPDFPFRLDPGSGRSGEMEMKAHENGGDRCSLQEGPSEIPPRRFQSSILDSIFSFNPYSLMTTQERGPAPFEGSCSAFPTLQDRMAMPNLTLEEHRRLKLSLPSNDVTIPGPDLLPKLSLGTDTESSVHDLPTRPFLPDFRLLPEDTPKLDRQMREVPPLLGLGLMQGTSSSLPENHKRVLENILMRTGSGIDNSVKKRFRVIPWTEDELDALWIGVRRYGKGNWDAMLGAPKLKFSKHRTCEDLAARWEEELGKIFDDTTQTGPKLIKPTSFSGISDEMMARALHGSGLSGLGGDSSGPLKSRAHLTDMRLGYGHPTSGILPVDTSDHFASRNQRYAPVPSWKYDDFQAHLRNMSAGPSNRPATSNLHTEPPYLYSSLPSLGSIGLQQKDREQGADKYAKLPLHLDRSLSYMHDSRNSMQSLESMGSRLFPGPNKQPVFRHPSAKDEAAGSDSSMNKLPHWLREAVSAPAGQPEPAVPPAVLPEPTLPPAVSAIARSVRMLYGEEKPTFPPFTVPGPPPSRPKDPRRRLRKKGKSNKQKQGTPDIASSSKSAEKVLLGDTGGISGSISLAPPLPSAISGPSGSVPSVETGNSLPPLNLNLMASKSPSVVEEPPSLEVVKLSAPCGAPSPGLPSVPDVATSENVLPVLEPSVAADEGRSVELKNTGEEERIGQVVDSGEEAVVKNEVAESGDSSKTHSDHRQEEVGDVSSEETVSDDGRTEQEPL